MYNTPLCEDYLSLKWCVAVWKAITNTENRQKKKNYTNAETETTKVL